MKKALIVYGGWDGHDPLGVSNVFKTMLEAEGYSVELSDTLAVYADNKKLKGMDLIIPHWTMGELDLDQLESVLDAVASGVGIAGCHAGLCDAFHDRPDWQWMAGAQFVSHPGGQHLDYTVNITSNTSIITEGVKDFSVSSELYYLQVDPAVEVLATTRVPVGNGPFVPMDHVNVNRDFGFGEWLFDGKKEQQEFNYTNPHLSNKAVDMPIMYTKMWGNGKVFYCSLGHDSDMLKKEPLSTIMKRGLLWASR